MGSGRREERENARKLAGLLRFSLALGRLQNLHAERYFGRPSPELILLVDGRWGGRTLNSPRINIEPTLQIPSLGSTSSSRRRVPFRVLSTPERALITRGRSKSAEDVRSYVRRSVSLRLTTFQHSRRRRGANAGTLFMDAGCARRATRCCDSANPQSSCQTQANTSGL